jgi:acetyl/propionyl-CoA carboxylase alpha subunit
MEIKIIYYAPESRKLWLTYNNKPIQAQLICKGNKKIIFLLPENRYIEIPDQTLLFKPAKKQIQEQDNSSILSPLSGCVVKILVEEGQTITPGQTIATIESMKMENEIRALSHALIQTIPIAQGDVVQKNQVLITLAPITSAPKNHLAEQEVTCGK